jgi:hypothetical protein
MKLHLIDITVTIIKDIYKNKPITEENIYLCL